MIVRRRSRRLRLPGMPSYPPIAATLVGWLVLRESSFEGSVDDPARRLLA